MKNTFNIGFFLIIFILVKFNVLLLNEETLILIVFSIFCLVSVNKIGPEIAIFFETQQKIVRVSITSSSANLQELLQSKQKILHKTANWLTEFKKLKSHFSQFNSVVLNQWPNLYKNQVSNQIQKKLNFSKRLEQQLLKLISLLILEKVKSFLFTQKFCVQNLGLKKFKSVEKTYFREHLTKL